ncbi:MAG: benzene 1,2-dioxygenase [Salinisphaeraceae bacterium]|nr:benzene 1,2-dioxygenase [Salinisphaeraceae bacterium]
MSLGTIEQQSIEAFLRREAVALDDRDWDTWLALFTEDCEYWVPAWRSDGKLVDDPANDISLIYYDSRIGLEARVYRLRTEKVSSAQIMPRTTHFFQIMHADPHGDAVAVRSHWTVHSVYEDRVATYFGHAHYQLVQFNDDWLIQRKKTIVQNDLVHQVLDFYNI